MSPKGSIGIPKLQLGVIQVAPSGDKGAVVAASHGTRSSRRMSHRGAFSPALPALLAAAGAQSRTAAQEMKSLAFKLGETYCTQDLTVLLQYKKRVLGSPVFTKHKEEENVVDAEEQIMRGTAYYRCKVDLLRVLDFIASDRRELSSIPSPINLLFQELATTYEHGVSIDDAKNALVFSVLGHLAQFNEHCAINAVPPPPAVTAGMPKEFVDVLSDDAKRGGAPGAAAAADLAVSASTPLAAVFSPRVATFLLPESHEDEATVAANAAAAAAVAATRDSDDDVHASTAIAAAATAAAAAAAPAAPLQTSTRGIAPTPSNNEHNVTEFLLMINNRLKVYLSTLLVDDLNVPLSVLADYMNKCRTRVLASRVVTVCLSSLLRVKQTIFSEALKVDSFRLVRTVHYLLMVFDEIAMQNSSSTLNTLLLSVLFEGTKNATFLQEYATQLLINEQFASKTLARRNGAWLLSQYRQRVIEHFRTLVAMVEREQELVLASVDSVGLGVTTTSVRAKRLDNRRTELLGKLLEPLVLPHVGIAAQFMQQCPPHRFYAEHVAMLHFLADLFAARCSPFVFEQSIIDAYVQHHYLEFVKLYTTAGLDSRSLTLVRLHLRVLLSFAKHKTSECAQKFYQLRVMDFLVREVASEFTITTSFVRGRGRADSVVAAPVVTEFLKQVQAAAASRAAATPSPTHGGDPLSARTAGSSRKTTRPKKASGGAASLSTASAAAAGKSDTLTDASAVDPTSTADESGNPADDDDAADLLLSPKSRARRRGRKTPRKGGVQPTPSSPDGGSSGGGSATQGDGLGAVAAAAASVAATAAAAAPTSVSSGTLPVVAPPGDADVIAALEAQIPPAPPKPEPLPQKPTVEQYKKFMIERYEYEQWENQASLVRRRIEHVRQMMAKDSWMDDSGAGPNSALPRSAMSPRDSPRASPRVMGSPRSPALRSPGRERRHRVDDTGGTGSQAGSDSEQIDRLQRHSSLPHSVGTSSAGGAAAAPALPFQLRIVPASNDSKGGAQPHRRNLTVTPAVTQAQPLVVGRGPSSGIHEKRLSRAHMEIFTQTTAGRATLVVRAIGGNPSFVKSRGTSSLRPLPQKQPYVVEDGDVVYLLDDQYAYEVVEPQYPSSSSDTEQPPQQPPQVQPLQLQQAAVKLQHRGTSSSSPMTVGVAVRRDSIKTFSEDSRPPLTTLSDTSEPEALDNGSHSPALAMRQNSSPLLQRPHVPTLRLERPGSTGEGEGAGATTPSLKKRIGSLFKGKRSGTSSGVHVKALDADIAAAAAIADASTADTAATLPDAGSSLAAAVVVPSTPNADDSLTSSKAGIEDSGADDAADDAQSSAAGGDDASATVHKKKRNRAKSHIHSVPRTKLATTAAAASAIVAAASTSPAPAAASPVATVSGTPPKPGGIAMMKPMLKLNIGSLGMSGLTGGSSEPIKPAAEVVAPPAAAATTTPNKATPGKLKLNLGSLGLTTSTSEPVIGNVPDAGGATTASEPAGKLFALKASTASPLAAAAALAQRSDERLVRYAPPQAPAVLNDDEAKRTYAQDRENHKLYHDTDLHALMLQLIFSMLTTANETLDPLYTAQYPLVQKKLNIPFILHQHINWPENRTILPRLQRGLLEHGTSAYRLFKLLCVNAFNPTAYANLERVATGAYGVVYFSQLVETPRDDDDDEDYGDAAGGGAEDDLRRKPRVTSVAVKLMDVPHSVHDRCVLHDIFTEILILEHFRADPDSCRLFDFGLDHEHYWITMKRYCGSLKEWRNRQRKPLEANLLLYMNIYEKVLRTIYKLHGHRIIHFDIKCDNFFIEPHTSGATLDEVVDQPTSEPNFSVALGDFGESMVFQDESDAYTTQNRGTECIRSPEMLAVANSRNVAHYDRRRRQGATTSSDMWSLGCAFYELCTTEFLFYDGDWGAFFARVTSTSIPLISQQRKDLVNNDQVVLDFLEYVFIRDPLRRPTIEDVIKRFGTMKRKVQRRADEGGASGDPSLWGMIGGEDERPLEREPRITRNLYEQQRHRDQLTQITDSLFISNAAAAHRRGELSGERGITHIIHVTVDRERKHGAGTATLVRTAPLQLSSGSGGGGGSGGTVATPGAGRSATLGRNTIATSVSARVPSKARPGSVTGGAANSSGQFVQLNVVLPVKPVGDEILPPAMLTRLYEFARRGSVIGKVLVYSDGSMQGAASVACALVMAEHECCFEASLQLLERRRPGCRPSAAHAAALDSYGDRCGFDGLVAFSVPDYRCLCGAATVTLRRKLHTLGVEPRPCRCAAGGKAGGGDARNDSARRAAAPSTSSI
jgi:serine/threonine protein kinase